MSKALWEFEGCGMAQVYEKLSVYRQEAVEAEIAGQAVPDYILEYCQKITDAHPDPLTSAPDGLVLRLLLMARAMSRGAEERAAALISNGLVSLYDYDTLWAELTMRFYCWSPQQIQKRLRLFCDHLTWLLTWPVLPDFTLDNDVCFQCSFEKPHDLASMRNRLTQSSCSHYTFFHELFEDTVMMIEKEKEKEKEEEETEKDIGHHLLGLTQQQPVCLEPDQVISALVAGVKGIDDVVNQRIDEDKRYREKTRYEKLSQVSFENLLKIVTHTNTIDKLEGQVKELQLQKQTLNLQYKKKTTIQYIHNRPYELLLEFQQSLDFQRKLLDVFNQKAINLDDALSADLDNLQPYRGHQKQLIRTQRLLEISTLLSTVSLDTTRSQVSNETFIATFSPHFKYTQQYTIVGPRFIFFKLLHAYQVSLPRIKAFRDVLKTIDFKLILGRPLDEVLKVLVGVTTGEGGVTVGLATMYWLTANLYAYHSHQNKGQVTWYHGTDQHRVLKDGFYLFGLHKIGVRFTVNNQHVIHAVADAADLYKLIAVHILLRRRYGGGFC
uniref:Protein Allo64 n=1 Tax=Lake sturgeon herpesvirus TaxID=2922427 RepID=A0A9E9GFH1_9VIRU|nr:protein Allo64 [Lake sturgeon herpesvirus]